MRLIYKPPVGLMVGYIISAFNSLVIVAIVTMPLFVNFSNTISSLRPYYSVFVVLFYGWAITNLYLFNSFVKIEGTDDQESREQIIEALSKHFELDNLDQSVTGIVRDVRLPWAFKNGRAVTCLLAENLIYLNAARLVRPGNMYFYSSMVMHFKCKRVAKDFQKIRVGNTGNIS